MDHGEQRARLVRMAIASVKKWASPLRRSPLERSLGPHDDAERGVRDLDLENLVAIATVACDTRNAMSIGEVAPVSHKSLRSGADLEKCRG
jgi:hypothetical protein